MVSCLHWRKTYRTTEQENDDKNLDQEDYTQDDDVLEVTIANNHGNFNNNNRCMEFKGGDKSYAVKRWRNTTVNQINDNRITTDSKAHISNYPLKFIVPITK